MICRGCGRELPPEIKITGKRRQLFLECLHRRPNGSTVWDLMGYIYADYLDGGPENHNIISVMVKQINVRIASQGWKIVATGGPGSTYHLKRI